jgi:hypothetical protein
LPALTVGCAGALGTVLGVTAADAGDAGPVPFTFVALTVHVYDFPFVSPPTTVGDAVSAAEPGVPPFDDVHTNPKPVIGLPPSAGGTNDTVTCAFPAVSVGAAGALGIVLGMTVADAGDAGPAPLAFAAVTVHVYDFPFVSAPTAIGDAVSEAAPATPPFDDTHETL